VHAAKTGTDKPERRHDGKTLPHSVRLSPLPETARMTATALAAETSPARPGRRAWRRSEEARGLAMISPTFLYALALLLLPVLVVVTYSFWTQDYLEIDRTFTLENYRQALSEP